MRAIAAVVGGVVTLTSVAAHAVRPESEIAWDAVEADCPSPVKPAPTCTTANLAAVDPAAMQCAERAYRHGVELGAEYRQAQSERAFARAAEFARLPIVLVAWAEAERRTGRPGHALALIHEAMACDPSLEAAAPSPTATAALASSSTPSTNGHGLGSAWQRALEMTINEIETQLIAVELVGVAGVGVAIDDLPLHSVKFARAGGTAMVANAVPRRRAATTAHDLDYTNLTSDRAIVYVAPGEHRFAFRLPDKPEPVFVDRRFRARHAQAAVAFPPERLEVDPSRWPARVRLVDVPRQAEVWLDTGGEERHLKKPAGVAVTSDLWITDLEPARSYELTIEREGYRPFERSIALEGGYSLDLDVNMRPKGVQHKWWFWTAIGLAAAGLSASIVWGLNSRDPNIEVRI